MIRATRLTLASLAAPFLAAMFLVSACGDGDKKTPDQSAAALRDYYYSAWQEPSPDWEVLKVRVAKDNTVTVQTNIATDTLTKAIMERSRMEQMEIARRACPPVDADIWDGVGKDQSVGIALSGTAGHIINALCKRR